MRNDFWKATDGLQGYNKEEMIKYTFVNCEIGRFLVYVLHSALRTKGCGEIWEL